VIRPEEQEQITRLKAAGVDEFGQIVFLAMARWCIPAAGAKYTVNALLREEMLPKLADRVIESYYDVHKR
jgi:hypothetical protein